MSDHVMPVIVALPPEIDLTNASNPKIIVRWPHHVTTSPRRAGTNRTQPATPGAAP
jgi:hypothetical protein